MEKYYQRSATPVTRTELDSTRLQGSIRSGRLRFFSLVDDVLAGTNLDEARLDLAIRDEILVTGGLDAEENKAACDSLHTNFSMFREACDLRMPKDFLGIDEEKLLSMQLEAGLTSTRALKRIFALQS